jgi:hypothetical protein
LTWSPKAYRIKADDSIGLIQNDSVSIRQLFPFEEIFSDLKWGDSFEVKVLPFRTCLILVSTTPTEEFGVLGCNYEIIRDMPGKPVIIKLMGMPGSSANIQLPVNSRRFASAQIDGVERNELIQGKKINVKFPGKIIREPWHKKLGTLTPCDVPQDAEALFEATCFAADNNALEVRSLQRSGSSEIPQVIAAREAFFNKKMFSNRGIWDKNLFDADLHTFFIARLDKRALRVDFDEPIFMDKLVIRVRDRQEHDLNPELHTFDDDTVAQVSKDLKTWTDLELGFKGKGTIAQAIVPAHIAFRYLRIQGAPQRIAEVEAYSKGKKVNRAKWRASNLFYSYQHKPAISAWSLSVRLPEIHKNSYLAVALNGRHGDEGAYAALRVDDAYVGAPDRSVSFPSNTWEYFNVEADSNYTYYFPLKSEMVGKNLDIVVLILQNGLNEIKPEAWITAYPFPYASRELVLFK